MKNENEIPESLKSRASAVGFTVDSTRADDGTYWIPSIGKWRSIEQIEETVAVREEQSQSSSMLG